MVRLLNYSHLVIGSGRSSGFSSFSTRMLNLGVTVEKQTKPIMKKEIRKLLGKLFGIYCPNCGGDLTSYGWYDEKTKCFVCYERTQKKARRATTRH